MQNAEIVQKAQRILEKVFTKADRYDKINLLVCFFGLVYLVKPKKSDFAKVKIKSKNEMKKEPSRKICFIRLKTCGFLHFYGLFLSPLSPSRSTKYTFGTKPTIFPQIYLSQMAGIFGKT